MSSNLSSWYNNSYNGPWSRTSQLRVAPFIATSSLFTPNPLSESAATMSTNPNQPGGIINAIGPSGYPLTASEIAANAAAGVGLLGGAAAGLEKGGKKRLETFFGPDVGVDVDAEKGWLNREGEGEAVGGAGNGQKLPLSVVKDWIEKSKSEDTVHPTTTLQALVNLKRPTLSLIAVPSTNSLPAIDEVSPFNTNTTHPLASTTTRGTLSSSEQPKHLLRFLYDASSPLVRITLSLHHRPSSPAYMSRGPTSIIYTGVHSAGFGKTFELPKEKAIDLQNGMERERSSAVGRDSQDGDSLDSGDEKDLKRSSTHTHGHGAVNELRAGGGDQADNTTNAQPTVTPNVLASPAVIAAAQTEAEGGRRRFGFLGRRRNRQSDLESGGRNGIELQTAGGTVPPAEPTPDQEAQKAADEDGLRVLIRIDALDAEGQPLNNVNSQLNHILVTGALVGLAPASAPVVGVDGPVVPPAPATENAEGRVLTSEEREAEQARQDAAAEEEENVPKKWVWMVKVVRREAVIGTYTFLLKEIYGLSSSSAADDKAGADATAYPNPTDPLQNVQEDPYASTSNECIVCLTNPRDVVLLPCRHLVVCRECAVGMVEFGAGGKVARREEVAAAPVVAAPTLADGTATEGEAAAGAGATIAGNPAPPAAPTPAPTRERRRKKAKGWFCPVCRQSYTSLLRLALPSTLTPEEADEAVENALSRVPSRASHHTLHRVSSRATIATLPARGEELLESMLPAGIRDIEDEEEDAGPSVPAPHSSSTSQPAQTSATPLQPLDQRPQFVLGDPLDGERPIADKELTQVEREALSNKKVENEFKDVPL